MDIDDKLEECYKPPPKSNSQPPARRVTSEAESGGLSAGGRAFPSARGGRPQTRGRTTRHIAAQRAGGKRRGGACVAALTYVVFLPSAFQCPRIESRTSSLLLTDSPRSECLPPRPAPQKCCPTPMHPEGIAQLNVRSCRSHHHGSRRQSTSPPVNQPATHTGEISARAAAATANHQPCVPPSVRQQHRHRPRRRRRLAQPRRPHS